ncbi:single-stranded DNA-binding protein [Conexibacter sp. W3-3-2]|uniref:single-stranded DNA-binding protein n=1 Tax=Conexibacter sp. W3-3-2 TaxID=2675227 RepID=UPI0012B9CC4C|nr:single-stranded DNA-binding protein [Conexibacter sp. W3-3-2]MTD44860.1 single-stranded DNA-binding protein [Conexibacter sp. W3-3-2]
MLNTVALVGRLTRDPELRETGSGRPVCDLRLAVDARGEEPACFVDVVCFDAGAQACQQYLTKGRLVAVDGRLVLDEWTTSEGEKRSRHKVIGQVKFLPDGTRPDRQEVPDQPAAA